MLFRGCRANSTADIALEETVALLRDSDRENLRKELDRLVTPVKLIFFSHPLDCEYCPLTKQVLEEIIKLTDKVTMQEYDFSVDHEAVAQYKIARVPAIALVRIEQPKILLTGKEQPVERDYGIRYYGVPAGFEFAALVGDIVDVSNGESGLSEQSKVALRQLKEPLHLQVFSTPT